MPKGPADAAAELSVLAAADLEAAEILASRAGRLRPLALFHCQQAAEKWVKALLVSKGRTAPRTHALGALLDLAAAVAPAASSLHDDADLLAPFAVAPRYILRPVGDGEVVKRALDAARRFRDLIATLL